MDLKEILSRLKDGGEAADGLGALIEQYAREQVEAETKSLKEKRDELLGKVADPKLKEQRQRWAEAVELHGEDFVDKLTQSVRRDAALKAEFGDDWQEKLKHLKDEEDRQRRELAAKEGKLDELIAAEGRKLAKEKLDGLQVEVDKLKGEKAATEKKLAEALEAHNRDLRDTQLTEGLTGIGVTDQTALRAARRFLEPEVEVAEVDGRRALVVKRDGKVEPLGDFLSAWSATDEGKYFVTAPRNAGGGAGNLGAGSGQSAGSLKLTRQQMEDPAAYRAARERAEKEGLELGYEPYPK